MGVALSQAWSAPLAKKHIHFLELRAIIAAVLGLRALVRLSWLEEMVLSCAWQAGENRQCHAATSSLVWFCPS